MEKLSMARKTFISYKYSDVVAGHTNNLRDRIIAKLGDGSRFYRGENGYTKDISSYSAGYIKETLKKMIRDTSVTIIILSPNMKLSEWMNWELTYSLMITERDGRRSLTNGVVAVVQKQPTFYGDGYAWFKNWYGNWAVDKAFEIIRNNQNNRKPYVSENWSPNYIDIISEDTFIRNPEKYIEEAYNKAQNLDYYNVSKQGGIW